MPHDFDCKVGGDLYDFFFIDDDHLCFAVGDVSGKGVPAALFMSMSRTILKAIASQGGEAGAVLATVNDLLAEENDEGMFVTMFFGRLDLETGRLDYACGGHDEVFVLSADGGREQIEHLGPAIGLFPGVAYPTLTRTLLPGDALFLATDGVTEAFDPAGDVFGLERLNELLRPARRRAARELVETVHAAVDRFAAGEPRSDDTTCLAVAYVGAPAPAP